MLKSVPVTSYVEMMVCDAHQARGADVEAVTAMTLPVVEGGTSPSLDLCEECARIASEALLRAFGMDGGESVPTEEVRPVEVAVPPRPEAAAEGGQDAEQSDGDFRDYCARITDSRSARKGQRLVYGTQSARAQYERHRQRVAKISAAERSHFEEWCRHNGHDVNVTASHVVFRGWLWEHFPTKGREYADALKARSGDANGTKERDENRVIREWARDHGYVVSARGRISMQVRHAYRLALRESADKESHAA
ncbi:histone-like nucleoid-structuring protein Lsr2 [Streptomyces sp. NPDC057555]|uniref:Lsr2 family DNA-binding protein n=1 Tax=Streptomyces sp. NPDC057555 TaxID=3346166 RepID=UPI0036B9DF15